MCAVNRDENVSEMDVTQSIAVSRSSVGAANRGWSQFSCCLIMSMSTTPSRPNKAGLTVRPSVCPQKVSDLNEIWTEGRRG